ncbi:MAG TPA: ABC transporter permease subunit [Clostridiales bacterium]|nr:ABC transporter permease subunit [Clostridiales bacterium]
MVQNTSKLTTNINKSRGFKMSRDLPIYGLLLPGVILLIIFHYLPLFGIVIAFQDFVPFKGVIASKWVGFRNFAYFLTDENFWLVMKNTLEINIMQIIFGFPVPILFALFLNELWSNRFKKTVQTISYLPHFISWVVAASIVTSILSPSTGIVNQFLKNVFGIQPIHFLAMPKYFRPIIIISSIWKEFGMNAVYYMAALSSIDLQLYEASRIDGAGKLRQTWHITLPGIKNITIVLLVLQVGSLVTIGFERIFLLYNPLVYEVGDVISTYTYRIGIEQARYSLTAAIGFTQSFVNFILVYLTNRLAKAFAGWALW